MALNGYLKLHRRFLDWEWYGDVPTKVVFLDLLLHATHYEHDWRGIHLMPGQVPTSVSSISKNTGLTTQQIRTALKHLENTGEINKQTTNKLTVVTIEKWALYQGEEVEPNNKLTGNQQTTNKQLTNNQQQLKNGKNGKNGKNINKAFAPPTLEEVKSFCKEHGYSKVDPEAFMDYYNSNGWMVGKNKMKNWQAAVRNWERRDAGRPQTTSKPHTEPPKYRQFEPDPKIDKDPMPEHMREKYLKTMDKMSLGGNE